MANELPYVPFFTSDFLIAVLTWPPDRVGAYVLALCYQWEHGGVPADDPQAIAMVLHQPKGAPALWQAIASKFIRGGDGLWRNLRLEEHRVGAQQRMVDKHTKAVAAANARWSKRSYSRNAPASATVDASASPDALREQCSADAIQIQSVQVQDRYSGADAPPCGKPVENLKSSTPWKRACAIAHLAIEAYPKDSASQADYFKTLCAQQGIAYGERNEAGQPLFRRALDYVGGVRARRQEAS